MFQRLTGDPDCWQVYTGQWAHGKRQGLGKLEYAEDLYFEGEWNEDSISGMGVLVAEGERMEGIFEADDITDEKELPSEFRERLEQALIDAAEVAVKADDSKAQAVEHSDAAHERMKWKSREAPPERDPETIPFLKDPFASTDEL